MSESNAALSALLSGPPDEILQGWRTELVGALSYGATRGDAADAAALLRELSQAIGEGADAADFDADAWEMLREALATLANARAAQGQLAGDTATFLMALKRPLMLGLQAQLADSPQALFDAIWRVSGLVDKMAQWSATTFQQSREDIIRRQQDDLLELSTPVVKLWDGVLAVPMIGTLDSSRTQLVMESLLQAIVETGSELAIIDITGVPTVDTLVAQHLLKTVDAIRLMGADCIISGIRPQIAQTIVHLGIDLQGVTTKSTLADALALALRKTGFIVSRDKR